MVELGSSAHSSDETTGRRIGETMQVLAMASQKGGSGKTTLTGHMAVMADRAGAGPVAVVDTDPQGSLIGWARARSAPTPAVFASTAEELPEVLVRLRNERYRLVLVDTPPAVTAAISEVVNLADLVIIPTRPSPHDLRAVGATVDICEGRGRPMIFVVNSATPRARITSDAAIALSQHGTVAPTTLHHRVDYAASMIDGRTVMEVNEKCRSAKEVVALWEYIGDRLSRMASEPAQAPQPAAVPVAADAQQAEDSPAEPLATTSPPGATPVDVQRAQFPAHGPADFHRRNAPTFGRRNTPSSY